MFNKKSIFFTLLILLISLPFLLGKFGQKNSDYVYVYLLSSGGEWWWQLKNTPEWLRDQVYVGAKEISPSGEVNAELVEVQRFGTSYETTLLMKVKLKVDTSFSNENESYLYKGEPLLVGKSLVLTLDNTQVSGNIVSFLDDAQEEIFSETARVHMVIHDAYPWFAEQIQIGDLYTSDLNDAEQLGDKLVQVVSKEIKPSSEITLTTRNPQSGQKGELVISGSNPSRVNIELDLLVPVTKRNNVYYAYFSQPLKVGSELYLSGNRYDLLGLVTNYTIETSN